jgi:hypothetical protein
VSLPLKERSNKVIKSKEILPSSYWSITTKVDEALAKVGPQFLTYFGFIIREDTEAGPHYRAACIRDGIYPKGNERHGIVSLALLSDGFPSEAEAAKELNLHELLYKNTSSISSQLQNNII